MQQLKHLSEALIASTIMSHTKLGVRVRWKITIAPLLVCNLSVSICVSLSLLVRCISLFIASLLSSCFAFQFVQLSNSIWCLSLPVFGFLFFCASLSALVFQFPPFCIFSFCLLFHLNVYLSVCLNISLCTLVSASRFPCLTPLFLCDCLCIFIHVYIYLPLISVIISFLFFAFSILLPCVALSS